MKIYFFFKWCKFWPLNWVCPDRFACIETLQIVVNECSRCPCRTPNECWVCRGDQKQKWNQKEMTGQLNDKVQIGEEKTAMTGKVIRSGNQTSCSEEKQRDFCKKSSFKFDFKTSHKSNLPSGHLWYFLIWISYLYGSTLLLLKKK